MFGKKEKRKGRKTSKEKRKECKKKEKEKIEVTLKKAIYNDIFFWSWTK